MTDIVYVDIHGRVIAIEYVRDGDSKIIIMRQGHSTYVKDYFDKTPNAIRDLLTLMERAKEVPPEFEEEEEI